ncbi:MAG: XdhC/CoxI family protein [Myxococcota bacterium]
MRDVLLALAELLERGEHGALATVTKTSGSTPQEPGARLLLRADGTRVGTVGGGAVEEEVLRGLRQCLVDRRPRVLAMDLGRDLGMCCGGRMEVFVELLESTPRLILFGAGHVAQPTAETAVRCGFAVTVVDDREELNSSERFPECIRIVAEPDEAMDDLRLTERDWILIITHDHRMDEEALSACLDRPHHYIGMIGSKRKVFRVIARIQHRRALPSMDRVYAPVGLAIGAVSPAEIGVSIVGELIALRHGAPAPHMRAIDHPALQRVLQGELTPEAAAQLRD